MKLNVTQKILTGYVLGFILLWAFAALTYFNGIKIEATTVSLAEEKVPALIAVSHLKSNLQAQTNQLYELYATNDVTAFESKHAASATAMLQHASKLQTLAEFKQFDSKLTEISAKQAELRAQFVEIMRQPEVNWDSARQVLSAFSASADEMGEQLDQLVNNVSEQTLAQAKASQQLTEQLINLAMILAGLILLGVLAVAYYAHRQVAVPLRQVSASLSDVATRRDLTYRLKQYGDDEVGAIAVSANQLLEEFQKLARTLDGTAQEVNRATTGLTEITEGARVSMADRNAKLRTAAQDFMRDIQASSKQNSTGKEIDMDLHRAQMKFIQTHLSEIDEGTQATDRNVRAVQSSTDKLQKLAENMHGQIRLLNF
jgi:nitrate/nitrite-specific signal transduction histidine kinase